VLFPSNWEKSLGTHAKAAAGERARQDVFLPQLKGIDAGEGDLALEPRLEIDTMALTPGFSRTVRK
jgi:hypothetical protein